MNGMNKTIYAVVSILALAYVGLSLFATMNYTAIPVEGGKISPIYIYLFWPNADSLGINLTEFLHSLGVEKNLYGNIIENFVSIMGLDEELSNSVEVTLMMVGFLLALGGFIAKPSWDVAGRTNPAEYLWTHRPRAFLRCMLVPWGLIIGAWQRKKPLVIIPVLLLFLYYPWAVMMSISLLVPFIFMWVVNTLLISSARKKEEAEYSKNTEYSVCPFCKRNFDRPLVKCRCGLELEYPVPNIYGFKYHTCNNGHDISCRSGQRANLSTLCPHCKVKIATREARPITISLVGATGSGKTTLMLAAVQTISVMARTVDVTMDSPSPSFSSDALMAKDYAPKTIAGELESQVIFLRSLNLQDREIIFNDISGQEFQPSTDKVIFEEYYNYTDGIIFTFNPFSLAREVKRETPQEVFDSFYYMFSTVRNASPSAQSEVPFAVVATKSDIDRGVQSDEEVRQFLIDNGEQNFVRLVESLFKNVRYFAVCSYGDNCASAMRPVWWIAGFADKELVDTIPLP
jgi:GTPase SAR1 family protein